MVGDTPPVSLRVMKRKSAFTSDGRIWLWPNVASNVQHIGALGWGQALFAMERNKTNATVRSLASSAAKVGFIPHCVEKQTVADAESVIEFIARASLFSRFAHLLRCRKILASFRRFLAVAASRNSSSAPHGPRNRRRPRPRMRSRWANSFSTFFQSLIEMSYCLVMAISRATWRASSYLRNI